MRLITVPSHDVPTSLERMDIGDLRQRLGNDEVLIADLLRLFLEDYPAQLAIRRSANKLKGVPAPCPPLASPRPPLRRAAVAARELRRTKDAPYGRKLLTKSRTSWRSVRKT